MSLHRLQLFEVSHARSRYFSSSERAVKAKKKVLGPARGTLATLRCDRMARGPSLSSLSSRTQLLKVSSWQLELPLGNTAIPSINNYESDV